MFDADRRLVVCNQRYAQMYTLPPELVKVGTPHQTIIGHRVKHGILASENTETAANQKLETLNAHSTEKTSSRVDKLADGRLVKVTRDPMLDGGWVAIHEDVTDQTRRDFIDSTISSFRERIEGVFKTVSDSTIAMKTTATNLLRLSESTSERPTEWCGRRKRPRPTSRMLRSRQTNCLSRLWRSASKWTRPPRLCVTR